MNTQKLNLSGEILQYTQTNCFIAAAAKVVEENCGQMRKDFNDKAFQKCTVGYMKQVGKWKTVPGSNQVCLPSCKRQENKLETSFYKFPNGEFRTGKEFLKVIRKLFWSCQNETTRFGFKRRHLSIAYPKLCEFYDKYFYTNESVSSVYVLGKGRSQRYLHMMY